MRLVAWKQLMMSITVLGETLCCPCKVGSGTRKRCFSDPVVRQELWSIESKSEVISSKIDTISDGCALTPITAPTTITLPRCIPYCLANNIDGTITIDVPNVFFDLNGHTIQNSTNGIIVNGDRATIKMAPYKI
jgi:hypothetical protein